jgi:hypothetical protein
MGLLPLEYILGVVRDPAVEPEWRDRMAVAAAPYIHPRLAEGRGQGRHDGQVEVKLTREELDERARRIIEEAFRHYQPPGHEEARTNGPVIEHRSDPAQDDDRGIAVSGGPKPITRRSPFRQTLRGRVRSRPCPAWQGGLYPGVAPGGKRLGRMSDTNRQCGRGYGLYPGVFFCAAQRHILPVFGCS